MLPPFARKYVLIALSGTPDVLDGFLKALPSDDPRWDFRPDPERFTLREMIAHLADWNPIFQERVTRICAEEAPVLPDRDEGQIAVDRDYAHSDPQASLSRFRAGRAQLLAYLQSLEPEQWERTGSYMADHPRGSGAITVEDWAVQVVAHDGYHTQQTAQWLAAAK
jgi:hypothetical protein